MGHLRCLSSASFPTNLVTWFDTRFGLANLGLMFGLCLIFDLCLKVRGVLN